MDDDRLASELQRRASGASPRPDWAKRDLLPAVWREIDARPQPVLASRWSPLAGLATLVVALLVLVVAVPRLGPQPPSATSTPASPLVLTTPEFAAGLAAGALDGKTVLVDGGIVAYDGPVIFGGYCGPNGPACLVGQLEGVTPRVVVVSPDIAVASSGDSTVSLGDGWPWWARVAPPIHGALLFSVGDVGGVEYVGRVLSSGDQLIWSVTDAAALDINSLARDEVVLTDGWLGGISGAALRCRAPTGPIEPSLPRRWCGGEWIASEATPSVGRQLVVQNGAYAAFAPNPSDGTTFEPRHATYALAPRLEGWCGGAQPPCWLWNVVGRVDADVGAAPTPSPIAPAATLHDCGAMVNAAFGSAPIFVADASGAVRSCTAESGMPGGWPAGDASVIVQPVGDATNEIEVAWATDRCSPERIVIEVKRAGSSLAVRVIVDRSGGDGYECVDLGARPPRRADLTLAEPIDPASVSVDLVIEPDLHADLPRTFDCTAAAPAVQGSLGPGSVPRIVDHTGVVTGCSQLEAGAPVPGSVEVTQLNGFDSVRFDWIDQSCDGSIEGDFEAVQGGYKLAVKQPSQPCPPGASVAIALTYRIPMPTQLVSADVVGPPPVVACADTPNVTVVDEVGVVGSCGRSHNTTSPAEGDIGIQNPGGDTSALQVSWSGALCTYEIHLSLLEPGEYGIQVYQMSTVCRAALVTYSLTLQLTSLIPADQITLSSIGGPPRSPSPSPWYVPDALSVVFCDASTDPEEFANGKGLVLDTLPQHSSPPNGYGFRIVDGTDPITKANEIARDPAVCRASPVGIGIAH